jgi:hypothetical protein
VPRRVAILPLVLLLSGCATLARQATTRFAEDLSNAILDQNDVATVRDGAPAYLLAMDGLIEGDPESSALLLSGARLYGSYASAFVEDEARIQRLWDRALGYGRRALCVEMPEPCGALDGPYDDFAASLASVERQDVPTLYGFGVAWAGWLQANAGDWGAVAEIPKIQALMERVVELDDSYDQGSAHLYLGVLLSLRPASLGGQPERGREHFERALEISERRNLMAQVLFARQYARLVFDRPLHDRLLREVVEADPRAPGRTLSNTLALEQALLLLDDADDYF